MKTRVLSVRLPSPLHAKLVAAKVGYVSKRIVALAIEGDKLSLEVGDDGTSEKEGEVIIDKIMQLAGRVNLTPDRLVQTSADGAKKRALFDSNISGIVHTIGNGLVVFDERGTFLFEYFDTILRRMNKRLGAVERTYPVLLPLESYLKTGYLKTSPQYAMFCCGLHEDLDLLERANEVISNGDMTHVFEKTEYGLSPAACFHVYHDLKDTVLPKHSVFSFRQRVFRNEGRFSWSEFGRLRDYTVRELVAFGSADEVVKIRELALTLTLELIEELGLEYELLATSDAFVVPIMERFKGIQVKENAKLELRLGVSAGAAISVSSFNLHGSAFTRPFFIGTSEPYELVSGCVGHGLDRWVMSFLAQHGEDPTGWPEAVRNAYERYEVR